MKLAGIFGISDSLFFVRSSLTSLQCTFGLSSTDILIADCAINFIDHARQTLQSNELLRPTSMLAEASIRFSSIFVRHIRMRAGRNNHLVAWLMLVFVTHKQQEGNKYLISIFHSSSPKFISLVMLCCACRGECRDDSEASGRFIEILRHYTRQIAIIKRK